MIVKANVHLPGNPPMMPGASYDVDESDATIQSYIAGGFISEEPEPEPAPRKKA